MAEKVLSKRETHQVAVEVGIFETEGPMRLDARSDEASDGELVESPYSSGLDELRRVFIQNTEGLIFRTIDSVTVADEDVLCITALKPLPNGYISASVYEAGGPHPVFTAAEKERIVEKHARKFFCLTKSTPLRPGTKGEKKAQGPVLLRSENYSQLDFFENMDFKFGKGDAYCKNTVVPMVGDIVCISPSRGKQGPEAKHWFVCSPQFLRTWTLIHYREHDAIRALASDEAALRKKVFSGNTTMTNAYLAWLAACYENGFVSEEEELEKRFWNLRTEFASREFVHVYSALVMMLRYAECPGPNNIPNKLDGGPKMRSWHIPVGWLERLFEKYELRLHSDPAIRFVDVPVPSGTPGLPKGVKVITAPQETVPIAAEAAPEVHPQGSSWGDYVVEENDK